MSRCGWIFGASVLLLFFLSSTVYGSEAIIHRYSEPGIGSVNSYIIEGDDELVLIDAQRVLSSAERLSDKILSLGKPLHSIVITHPHPDHFGGLAAVLDQFPGTPVYASKATQDEISKDTLGYAHATKQVAPEDSPKEFPIPTNVFQKGQKLETGSFSLEVHEIGAGESISMTVLLLDEPSAFFSSDLVAYQMTPFMLEGRTSQWLKQLESVGKRFAGQTSQLMPGHGEPGDFQELLDWQTRYLMSMTQWAAEANGMSISEAEKIAFVQKKTLQAFPGFLPVAAIPNLLQLNIKTLLEVSSQIPN